MAPFSATEIMLCYFVTSLAQGGYCGDNYLVATLYESLSLSRLRLVQNGIRRERTYSGHAPQSRLPVTLPLSNVSTPAEGGRHTRSGCGGLQRGCGSSGGGGGGVGACCYIFRRCTS